MLGREPRSARLPAPAERSRASTPPSPRPPDSSSPGDMSAGRLRTAEQQKVEILRALSRNAELIVMDEPSAALSEHETRQLHEIIRSLARAGTSILLISHFLREVLDLADTVTVLRDGEVVRTAPASAETRVVADRGDARPAADVDVPAQAVPRRATRPSGSRCASCRAPGVVGRDTSTCARARSSASPGSSARGAPSWPAPSSAPRACSRATAVLETGGGARPQPAPQPRGGPRDDPRVPQGRRA